MSASKRSGAARSPGSPPPRRGPARPSSLRKVLPRTGLVPRSGKKRGETSSVAQRTHEIGVRVALGAGRREILRMVVGQAFRVAVLGLGIGIPVAYILTRVMSSSLLNVVAVDPMTFALPACRVYSGLLAGYIPARRAVRVDPVVALRHE